MRSGLASRMARRFSSLGIIPLHAGSLLAVFLLAGAAAVLIVQHALEQDARREAQEKARMLLDHNLAIHSYFNKDLKPSVFRLTDAYRPASSFDPVWMSSTYAVRGINRYSTAFQTEQYSYKECAINARSPQNEADPVERAFIEDLNRDAGLVERSEERLIDGNRFYVVMRRGESMEDPCLRCHSAARDAPAGLVEVYGPERSFARRPGEVVSAISIRIPLGSAYRHADKVTLILSASLVLLLLGVYGVQYRVSGRLIFRPLELIRATAAQISSDEGRLGEQIPEPAGRELRAVTSAFNRMSAALRHDRDHLEEQVAARTRELTVALDNVKTLSGMIPICAACKKVRDDEGYWNQVEVYIRQRSNAEFTHGICPDCAAKLYPGFRKPPP